MRLVHPYQVPQRDLGLTLEDPVDVIPPALERHVPLADVANSLGILEERCGHQGDVAQRRAAEVRDHGPSGGTRGVHVDLDRGQVGIGHRLKLLQVVRDVQVVVVEVLLADDRVEEVKPSGHPPAGPGRQSPWG